MENNTGYLNSGNSNSGDRNSGYFNSGDGNSGDGNSGDGNSGSFNSGDRNSGSFNSGDFNSGYFNTQTPDEVLAFGKLTNREEFLKLTFKIDFLRFDLTKWISEEEMTIEEKEQNEKWEIRQGFLKTFEYKEAFQNSYNDLSEEERNKQTKLLKELPNFDVDMFFEISGIDLNKEIKLSKEEFIAKHQDELYENYLRKEESMITINL